MPQVSNTRQQLPIELLDAYHDQSGKNLRELTAARPCLVVFLRHSGCTFCREACGDIARRRREIESTGAGIILVHMMGEAEAARFFASFQLADVSRISDPDQKLYEAFELPNGTLWQLLGPANWWSGAKAFFGKGHGVGIPSGNVLRLPGSFLVHQGTIVRAFRGTSSSDKPDYCELAKSPTEPAAV